jgi:hypothetical protein
MDMGDKRNTLDSNINCPKTAYIPSQLAYTRDSQENPLYQKKPKSLKLADHGMKQ